MRDAAGRFDSMKWRWLLCSALAGGLLLPGGSGCVSTPSSIEAAFYYRQGSTKEQYVAWDKAAREFAIHKTEQSSSVDLNAPASDERRAALLLAEAYRDAFFVQQGWKRVTPEYAERRWAKESRNKPPNP